MAEKRKYFKDEIRKTFIIYALVPTLILSVLFYNVLLFYSVEMVKQRNKSKNENVAKIIEESFDNYLKEMAVMAISPDVERVIKKNVDKTGIYEKLYGFVNKQSVKSVFYIIDTEGNIIVTNAWEKALYTKEEINEMEIMDKGENPNEVKFLLNKKQPDQNTRRVYTLSREIIGRNHKKIGYIFFDLIDNDINGIIYKNKSDLFVITDRFKNAIVTTNNLVLDYRGKFKPAGDKNGYAEIDGEKYFMTQKEIVSGNISVYSLTSMDFINKFYITGIVFMIIVFLLIVASILFVAKRFSVTKTKSIDELIYAIKRVRDGDLDTKVTLKTNDEFELLGDYYNEMIIQLNELIKQNNEQARRSRIAELKQLEAQFNPHFLFNTLEILKYMIKIDTQAAVKIVVSMANLLRYSINYEREKIKLEDDIKYIEDYLIIQKYRFNKKFDYEIEIDEEAKQAEVPKLIIQPLIENSLKYGFEKKGYLKVILKCSVENENLILKVIDFGSGMTAEKLKEIKNILDSDDNLTNHVGLYNVHRRINLIYGAGYGLKIEGIEGTGTEITVSMPKIKG